MSWLLRMLAALFFPACGFAGIQGLPPAAPIDMATLQRTATDNTALAAPPGFLPTPDIVTRAYTVPPARLYAAIRQVAEATPRVFLAAAYDERRQAHYVARSKWLNFPDLVAIQVTPDSRLILWSRSVYGRSDLGVNKARLAAWLEQLDRALAAG